MGRPRACAAPGRTSITASPASLVVGVRTAQAPFGGRLLGPGSGPGLLGRPRLVPCGQAASGAQSQGHEPARGCTPGCGAPGRLGATLAFGAAAGAAATAVTRTQRGRDPDFAPAHWTACTGKLGFASGPPGQTDTRVRTRTRARMHEHTDRHGHTLKTTAHTQSSATSSGPGRHECQKATYFKATYLDAALQHCTGVSCSPRSDASSAVPNDGLQVLMEELGEAFVRQQPRNAALHVETDDQSRARCATSAVLRPMPILARGNQRFPVPARRTLPYRLPCSMGHDPLASSARAGGGVYLGCPGYS